MRIQGYKRRPTDHQRVYDGNKNDLSCLPFHYYCKKARDDNNTLTVNQRCSVLRFPVAADEVCFRFNISEKKERKDIS